MPIIYKFDFKASGEATELWAKLETFTVYSLGIQKLMTKINIGNFR